MTKVLFKESEYSVDRKELYGNECVSCKIKFFPQRQFCPQCLEDGDMKAFNVPKSGTIYSYTQIHVAPKSFKTPYFVGFIDVDQDIRLFGHLQGFGEGNIKIGQRVNISLEEIGVEKENNETLYGVVFTVMKEAGK
jgi:uncharacterized OB-fold protein